MRIGIQTWGSDGDVLPYVALAQGLVAAGKRVTLVITSFDHKDYSSRADQGRLSIVQTHSPFENNLELLDFTGELICSKRVPRTQLDILLDTVSGLCGDEVYGVSADLCQSNDVVIAHRLCYPVRWMAERFGVPCVSTALYPFPLRPGDAGEDTASFSWRYPPELWQRQARALAASFPGGRAVGWEEPGGTTRAGVLPLIAASRVFCRLPQDESGEEHICGFFDLVGGVGPWHVSAELQAFLAAGERPFYLTFGSLLPRGETPRRRILEVLARAIRLAGYRGIIQVFAEDVQCWRSDEAVLFSPPAPYAEVFPQCRGVVHHGSAGTTHAATRAGCPSVVVSHIFDQVFWGQRLFELGLGSQPLRILDLTAEELAVRMRQVGDSAAMSTEARRQAARMAGEDGVPAAIRVIERWLGCGGATLSR
jgi:sterol 3beta-glucosyltransferase